MTVWSHYRVVENKIQPQTSTGMSFMNFCYPWLFPLSDSLHITFSLEAQIQGYSLHFVTRPY